MLMCLGTGLVLLGFGGQQLPAALSRVELPKFQLPTPKPSPSPAAATDSKLVVDLSDRKVSLFKQGKLQTKFPIAIGKEGWETPTGSFRISQKYQNPAWEHPITHEKIPPGSDRNPLGKWWIGFTMKGKLAIGFHGTQSEELVGEAVSHGCLRMKNADIEKLVRQVEVGTVVEVKR
jgi:lipoprotein-anchoring transpeptidase ErfK/SrfK